MKSKEFIGSKNFWRALSLILGGFILLAVILCICIKSNQPQLVEPIENRHSVIQQSSSNDDYSFEAVEERVNEVNENYGRGVKSAYYGKNSTMEMVSKQRMFFSGLKSTLIIILLVIVILIVLKKGFDLKIFKQKVVDEGSDENKKVTEEPKKKPVVHTEKAKPIQQQSNSVTEKAVETVEQKQDEDVQEVTDNCQLP